MAAMTQTQMYYAAVSKASDADQTFLELVNHPTNPLTREDLERNIERRPSLWSRYASWLKVLPNA